VCSAALNRRFGTGLPERPALYVELHPATPEGQRAEAELSQDLLRSAGGSDITVFHTTEERSALWAARHQLLWAIIGYFPGRRYRITDTAVPIGRLPEHALALGGTCTGEHGIGTSKLKYLSAEHGPAAAWMARIKALFDPDGLLNPGKVIPLLPEVIIA
jgi:D-lactate dehydrogenase (cytochrome)